MHSSWFTTLRHSNSLSSQCSCLEARVLYIKGNPNDSLGREALRPRHSFGFSHAQSTLSIREFVMTLLVIGHCVSKNKILDFQLLPATCTCNHAAGLVDSFP
jgi:hypothetical protein